MEGNQLENCCHQTDASAVNRYCIKVASGIYNEDNPLQMKAWVAIEGNSAPSTIINALNTTSNLFINPTTPVSSLIDLALGEVDNGYLLEVSNAGNIVLRNIALLLIGLGFILQVLWLILRYR